MGVRRRATVPRMVAFLVGAAIELCAHGQVEAPVPIPPSTPRAAAPAPVSRAVVLEPTGAAPLARDAETVVDAASTFEVELPVRAVDARLVLLDGADAHVPARATREVGAATRLALTPSAPLVPGSRYLLRVEGATARELRAADGAWAPASFPLLVAGTPPPPEPKRKPKKRGRR